MVLDWSRPYPFSILAEIIDRESAKQAYSWILPLVCAVCVDSKQFIFTACFSFCSDDDQRFCSALKVFL